MKTKEEIEILRADALAGDAGAQNGLGCAYASGDGVTKDLKEAFIWFEKAAQNGDKYGQYNTGLYCQNGFGCVKNVSKAIEWYEKAAMQGYGKAAIKLGENYEKGYCSNTMDTIFKRESSVVITADPDEAFYWYYYGRHNCFNSVDDDHLLDYHLALCYEQGIGTSKNLYRAYDLYQKSNTEDARKRLDNIRTFYNPILDTRLVSLDIIGNNPFRILGVFSNATERDIRANKSKIDAMVKVGKTPTFETDHILPCNISDNIETFRSLTKYSELYEFSSYVKVVAPRKLQEWLEIEKINPQWNVLPDRSSGNIQEAIQKIASDINRIKYALFWFCNCSPADNKAFKDLSAQNIDWCVNFINGWIDFHSPINRAILEWVFHRNNTWAIKETLKLISDDNSRDEFVSSITSGRLKLSKDELFAIFLDELFDFPETELSLYDLTEKSIKEEFIKVGKDYYYSKLFDTIVTPLEDLLRTAESQDPNDWEKCRKAYDNALFADKKYAAKKTVKKLKRFVGDDYYRYNLFCNEIALKFLEFGIHYNNDNNEDWNAPNTALRFATIAGEIATDDNLRERCKKNIDIFKNNYNIAQTEKAIEVINERIKRLDGISVTFSDIEKTLKSITTYLDIVRDHAGKDSAIYLNESSRVVNIFLNKVIDICNNSKSFFTDSGAAPILKQLQKMDMNPETRKRLDKNIEILSGHLDSVLGGGAWDRVTTNQQSGKKENPTATIQIKAPKSVLAGEKFDVHISINRKIDTIDKPQTSNLTHIAGPRISKSESTMYGSIKSHNTTFTYSYIANSEGAATIGEVCCMVEGKRLTSHCLTIQVQKGIPQQSLKTGSPERPNKQEAEEEELWKVCSQSDTYEIYLRQFPNGRHRIEALQRIKAKAEKRFWILTTSICIAIGVAILLIIKL